MLDNRPDNFIIPNLNPTSPQKPVDIITLIFMLKVISCAISQKICEYSPLDILEKKQKQQVQRRRRCLNKVFAPSSNKDLVYLDTFYKLSLFSC